MFVRSMKIAGAVLALAATTAAAQKVVSTKMGGGGSPHETVEWTVRRRQDHHQLRPAVPEGAARSLSDGRARRQDLAHRRRRGDDADDRQGADVRQPDDPGRDLHALHGAGPDHVEARGQQADRPVGHRVQRGQGSRPRRPQGRDAAEAGRAGDDRHHRSRRQPDAQHRLGHHARHRRRSWCTDCWRRAPSARVAAALPSVPAAIRRRWARGGAARGRRCYRPSRTDQVGP